MKHGKKTFVIIEAVLGILVILVLGFIIYKQNGHEPATIAVIIPDVDESEWSAFKYGLKMAAREYNRILLPYFTSYVSLYSVLATR